MHFKIVTPNGLTYDDTVEKVTVPTLSGILTLLEGHAPLVSVMAAGEILVHKKNDTVVSIACSGGILEVRPDTSVYVMADTAERAEHIDIDRAEAARARAEQLLKQQQDLSDVDFARIQALIEKEMSRISVGKKYRNLG